jgi:hypothetical protein
MKAHKYLTLTKEKDLPYSAKLGIGDIAGRTISHDIARPTGLTTTCNNATHLLQEEYL